VLGGRIVLLHHLPEPVGRWPERSGRGAVVGGRGRSLEQLVVDYAVHVQAGQQTGREGSGRRGDRR